MEHLKPDFDQLAAIEPRLHDLENRARELARTTTRNRQINIFYDYLKPAVCSLAGWDAKAPALRSQEAYDIVYRHICQLSTMTAYRKQCGFRK